MSGLLFELLTFKKCGWSTAEFDGTDWVWELESLTFNGSNWSIAEVYDRDWISESESFTFNGNSNWTEFPFFGLHLLNDLLLYVCFNAGDWFHGRLIDSFDEFFSKKNLGNGSLFWVFWEFRSSFFTFFSPFLFKLKFFFSKQTFSQHEK